MGRLFVLLWPVPALAASFVALDGSRSFWLGGFLTLALLWPVSLAVQRVAGNVAGAIVATLLCGLHVAQLALPPPIANAQPNVLERRFTTPQQAIRHTFRLPLGDVRWESLWARTPPAEAYLYFYVSRDRETVDGALSVTLDGVTLGDLSSRSAVAGSPEWHRLPVTRAQLETARPFTVVVGPSAHAPFVAGALGFGGGFSFRPSAPPTPSAFFDGSAWSSAPEALFPDLAGARDLFPQPGPQRFFVELRFIDPATRRFLGVYY